MNESKKANERWYYFGWPEDIQIAKALTVLAVVANTIMNYESLRDTALEFGFTGYRADMFPISLDIVFFVIHYGYFSLRSRGINNTFVRAYMYSLVVLSCLFSLGNASWNFTWGFTWDVMGNNLWMGLQATSWGMFSLLIVGCVETIAIMSRAKIDSKPEVNQVLVDALAWVEKLTQENKGLTGELDEANQRQEEFKSANIKLIADATKYKESLSQAKDTTTELEQRLERVLAGAAFLKGCTSEVKSERIKAFRRMLPDGVTQKEIAKLVGATDTYVSKTLNGKGK